jgi:uncharacterized protein (TIGR02231 family)
MGMHVASWEEAFSFLTRHLNAVVDSMRSIQIAIDAAEKELSDRRKAQEDFQDEATASSRAVRVDLKLANAAEVQISLDYVMPSASWKPIYDARLNPSTDEVVLDYFAEINQYTGENWDNVDMELSTSRPSEGATPGSVTPITLTSYVDPYANMAPLKLSETQTIHMLEGVAIKDPLGGRGDGRQAQMRGSFDTEYGNATANPVAIAAADLEGELESLAATFSVARKVTVPSGSESVRAPINRWSLKGEMSLLSRPRVKAGVYRTMLLTNQPDAPLLPGSMSIFAGNDFIGKFAVTELVAPGQTFDIPFGIDNYVTSKREILVHKKGNGGGDQYVEETIKITLANSSRLTREISLEEALPVSHDTNVKVKMGDINPEPYLTYIQGTSTWKVVLSAGSKEVILYSFKVEYPRGNRLAGM